MESDGLWTGQSVVHPKVFIHFITLKNLLVFFYQFSGCIQASPDGYKAGKIEDGDRKQPRLL